MSSTESLRKDHALIEKMIESLKTISSLLNNGKQIPESILDQAIDFSLNFTNACHHGKEEESLFPTLEKKGMPREGGPIARMLYEHEVTNSLSDKIVESAKHYVNSGDHEGLVKYIDEYVQHVSLHLSKENQRLFVMADIMLGGQESLVNESLAKVEQDKLNKLGKSHTHYEKLIENMNFHND
jgi:hemerythrin-like domain-containing protein